MNRIMDLQTALLDLLQKVHDSEVRLIAGGGIGIYLKTGHVRRSGMRTLLGKWPEPRSTNDLDLFLRPELLTLSVQTLDRIGRWLGSEGITGLLNPVSPAQQLLTTFRAVQNRIPGRLTPEIKAILEGAGAVLEGGAV